MMVNNASFTMVGNTYANAGKVSKQNSVSSKYDMMIERIQGQIQKINVKIQIVDEDKSLSPDEKKEKIKKLEEKLEEHQLELGRTKAARNAETVMEQSKEVKNNPVDNTSITKISSDGDILELSKTALLQADNSLKNLKDDTDTRAAEEENKDVHISREDNATGAVPVVAVSTLNEQTVQVRVSDEI